MKQLIQNRQADQENNGRKKLISLLINFMM